MKSYQYWTESSTRWSASVDFSSPVSAWTYRMLEIYDECKGDTVKATAQLQQEKSKGVIK